MNHGSCSQMITLCKCAIEFRVPLLQAFFQSLYTCAPVLTTVGYHCLLLLKSLLYRLQRM